MTDKRLIKQLVKCRNKLGKQRDELRYLVDEAVELLDDCTGVQNSLENAIDVLSKRL